MLKHLVLLGLEVAGCTPPTGGVSPHLWKTELHSFFFCNKGVGWKELVGRQICKYHFFGKTIKLLVSFTWAHWRSDLVDFLGVFFI